MTCMRRSYVNTNLSGTKSMSLFVVMVPHLYSFSILFRYRNFEPQLGIYLTADVREVYLPTS